MLNYVVLVGRIKEITENGVVLSIPRSYKNKDGVYGTDLITVQLFDNILENTKKYCEINDCIGIKGNIENENGKLVIKATKLSYLKNESECE